MRSEDDPRHPQITLIHIRLADLPDFPILQRIREQGPPLKELMERISASFVKPRLAYTSTDGGTMGWMVFTKWRPEGICSELTQPVKPQPGPIIRDTYRDVFYVLPIGITTPHSGFGMNNEATRSWITNALQKA